MRRSYPVRGWIGLILTAAAWLLNSLFDGLRTHLFFFPLWFGFILVLDGWVEVRSGTSLLKRSRRRFIELFLLSVPVWWFFELINLRTQNWVYLGREQFSAAAFAVFASLNFSTVIPVIFEAAELAGTWPALRHLRRGPRLRAGTPLLAAGLLLLALLLIAPRFFYPAVWVAPLLILEPINRRLRIQSLWSDWEHGDWRRCAALAAGSLLCGFFWEMWNLHSFPKWIYHVPFAGVCRVFEMPLPGYLGYPPFAWTLYSLYRLVCGLRNIRPETRTGPAAQSASFIIP